MSVPVMKSGLLQPPQGALDEIRIVVPLPHIKPCKTARLISFIFGSLPSIFCDLDHVGRLVVLHEHAHLVLQGC